MNKYFIIKKRFGYCNYSFEDNYVHIYNLYVYPKFRKQGKAKILLEKAIMAIRKKGYNDKISIVANPSDKAMKKKLKAFYKKLGLEVYDYYG